MRWSWVPIGAGFVVTVFFVTIGTLVLIEWLTSRWDEGR